MKDIYSRLMASQNASPKPAKKISREEYAKQKREQKMNFIRWRTGS